jgi:hypothetical protein
MSAWDVDIFHRRYQGEILGVDQGMTDEMHADPVEK